MVTVADASACRLRRQGDLASVDGAACAGTGVGPARPHICGAVRRRSLIATCCLLGAEFGRRGDSRACTLAVVKGRAPIDAGGRVVAIRRGMSCLRHAALLLLLLIGCGRWLVAGHPELALYQVEEQVCAPHVLFSRGRGALLGLGLDTLCIRHRHLWRRLDCSIVALGVGCRGHLTLVGRDVTLWLCWWPVDTLAAGGRRHGVALAGLGLVVTLLPLRG
mmetsp:Transcript_51392/g.132607  ORF Transcript_51392/g.132607 Transcript_51392/m.132607 type:complete len:220 (-) Transcript_51392:1007-1666(-)